MKRTITLQLALVAMAVLITRVVTASGPLGIYGIVDKVVFEPDGQSPIRIQVWGAFAYAEGGTERGLEVSAARRGYLYFQLPPVPRSANEVELIRREWADLKAVAGTGQAVGFGNWFYRLGFGALRPDAPPGTPSAIVPPEGGPAVDLRVRPASEAPSGAAVYQTNTGIVKLAATGSHAAIVRQLKDALDR